MLWRKAVFYNIILLIYDLNTSPHKLCKAKRLRENTGHLEVRGFFTDLTMWLAGELW